MADLPTPDQMAAVSRLFSALDPAGREKLLAGATRRSAETGEVVCKEGDPGDAFFVILEGQLQVTADDFGTSKVIATLVKGAFFGEMAVLTNQLRSASVTALQPCDLLVFGKAVVEEVLKDRPAIRQALGKVSVQRTEELMTKLSS